MESALTRRRLVLGAGTLLVTGFHGLGSEARRLKVVVTGGHPGDPECGCAGTIARYTQAGHQVTIVYLNRGEGFCSSDDLSRCATVRTREAEKACEILGAHASFAAQYDGRAIVDNAHYEAFAHVLDAEQPDVIFTQWPIDVHRDHRAVSALVLDAWLKAGKKAALYFYEVADDSMMFAPNEFVDISKVEATRRAACFAHASQKPDQWYPRQMAITASHGIQSGYPQAEAFARHWESRSGLLPA